MNWRDFMRHTEGGTIPLEMVEAIDGGKVWGTLAVVLSPNGDVLLAARVFRELPQIDLSVHFDHDPMSPDLALIRAMSWLEAQAVDA